eukprot:scaffold483848_cov23-Prasinocladus_malaysianus.AAC.1
MALAGNNNRRRSSSSRRGIYVWYTLYISRHDDHSCSLWKDEGALPRTELYEMMMYSAVVVTAVFARRGVDSRRRRL